jgi:phasin
MTGRLAAARMAAEVRRPNDDSLNGSLVSPARERQVHGLRAGRSKAAITLIGRTAKCPGTRSRLLKNRDQWFTMGRPGEDFHSCARDGPVRPKSAMSEERREHFEIPKEMRSMAEASFDQARAAFEKFVTSAQQTAGTLEERGATVRAGAKDIGAKAMSYAEKNVQASLDYAQSLLHAKDLTEVMRLHSEYVQAQMRSLAEQASEMGQIVSRAAMEAAKPKT